MTSWDFGTKEVEDVDTTHRIHMAGIYPQLKVNHGLDGRVHGKHRGFKGPIRDATRETPRGLKNVTPVPTTTKAEMTKKFVAEAVQEAK